MNISKVETIYEFTNRQLTKPHTGGVYFVMVDNKRKIFIRNGDSVGVVTHFLDRPAGKCVPEITKKAKEMFFELTKKEEGNG